MKSEKSYPTPFQRATCWAALTGLSLLVVALLIAGLVYGFGSLFIALEPVLLPVIIAGVLSYLLMPCVRLVQGRLRIRNRILAVLTVLAVATLTLVGLAAAILPPLISQTNELISRREQIIADASASAHAFLQENQLAQFVVDSVYDKARHSAATDPDTPADARQNLADARDYPSKVSATINFYSTALTTIGWRWLTAGTRAIYGAVGMLIGIVMIPVFLFYFLLKSEDIANNWHDVLPLRASDFREEVVGTLQQINDYIISFVRGQMLVSLIDGIILGIALKIIGLPYAITIAAAAALLGIIPYIGMISTSIPALVIAWFTWHDMGHVLAVVAIFVSVSQFDGWILQPKILSGRVGMHDLTIMFSVLFWSHVMGGIVGALLAVPLTASIKVIFIRYVWSTFTKDSHEDTPLCPAAPSRTSSH